MTYSPWPYPPWWPTDQVSTVSPLYSCTSKLKASTFESRNGWNQGGSPLPLIIRGASWLGTRPPGSFLGETKMYPGAASGELAFTLITDGRRSGRVRNALACPGPSSEAEARVREVGSQPSAPVSASPAAESAPRNHRRVILPPRLSLLAHFSAKYVLSSAWRRRTRQQAPKFSVLQPDPLRRATRRSRATP